MTGSLAQAARLTFCEEETESSGQGVPWFLQMETINSFGNQEEERDGDKHPSYFLGCKAPPSFY